MRKYNISTHESELEYFRIYNMRYWLQTQWRFPILTDKAYILGELQIADARKINTY